MVLCLYGRLYRQLYQTVFKSKTAECRKQIGIEPSIPSKPTSNPVK